jgi:hypothetical protein
MFTRASMHTYRQTGTQAQIIHSTRMHTHTHTRQHASRTHAPTRVTPCAAPALRPARTPAAHGGARCMARLHAPPACLPARATTSTQSGRGRQRAGFSLMTSEPGAALAAALHGRSCLCVCVCLCPPCVVLRRAARHASRMPTARPALTRARRDVRRERGGVRPVPVQCTRQGRARSQYRCGRGEPRPGTDVAGGEASPDADAAGREACLIRVRHDVR